MHIKKIMCAFAASILLLTSCTGTETPIESTDTAAVPSMVPAPSETLSNFTDTEGVGRLDAVTETVPAESVSEATVSQQTEDETAPKIYTPKVMMYHLILEEPYNNLEPLFVRPGDFESHLQLLSELGYMYLFAEEWRMTSTPSVILTFDDGYDDNYTNMFPILKKYGAKATIFLITDLIGTPGYMNEEQIREMSASGLVSFQSHTAHHNDLKNESEDQLRSELAESVEKITALTGKPVHAMAYPGGSFNDSIISVVGEMFDFAYTTKSPTSTPKYQNLTIPRYYVARGYGADRFQGFLT